MARDWCARHGHVLRIAVQVQPNAKKSEVVSEMEEALKIRLKAPAIEGKANEELIRFIADQLALPKKNISITHGQGNRQKLLEVESELSVVEIKSKLLRLITAKSQLADLSGDS